MAQTFPTRKEADLDKVLMTEIPRILRAAESQPSLRKRLARTSGMSARTIQKWCDGKNLPSLSSYIQLARCYPQLVDLFLDLCQRRPERQRKGAGKRNAKAVPPIPSMAPDDEKIPDNVPNDVPNRIDTSSCNIRQLWFINTLLEGEKVFAPDIAAHWRVTAKTAKRDITGLKSAGLITYQGTRRSGYYELAHSRKDDD
jgi:transcriptional regulator with XRE-family HTH domain